jgi:hypothetical protein
VACPLDNWSFAAWIRGERKGIFQAEKFQADLSKSPVPRFDLLDFKHYAAELVPASGPDSRSWRSIVELR